MNTSEFIQKAQKIWPEYIFDKTEYVHPKTKIIYECPTHGEISVFPYSLLTNHGCDKCQRAKPRRSKQWWLDNFHDTHAGTYDYSLLPDEFYSTDKIRIICKKHGIYEQTPQTHKRSGCPNCAKDNLKETNKNNPTGWSYSNWEIAAKRSKRFESFKVYVLKIWDENETFFKIGKTFLPIQKRFDQFILMPYNWEIFKIIQNDDARFISELEKKIQMENKKNKYKPLKHFSGRNECYSNVEGI